MDSSAAKTAADLLARTRQDGAVIDALPPDLRPATRQDGYQIQAQLEALNGKPLFGWKIAATSEAGQKHIAVDGPIAGRLMDGMVFQDGETVPFGANRMQVAEAEFVFRMGRDLEPRSTPYSVPEVMEAVADLQLGIEIPDSRYADFVTVGGPQLIADNACGHRFVIGPKAAGGWRDVDLVSHHVAAQIEGGVRHEGTGAAVLGDPQIALTWLVNELSGLGITLQAGHCVTTGTCITPIPIRPGDLVTVDYGALGQMTCRLGDR